MEIGCPTLLVNLEPGRSNTGLLQVASGLAESLGAVVIGVAARRPIQLAASGTGYVPLEMFEAEFSELDSEMRGAEAEFRGAFDGAGVEWRASTLDASPSGYVADQARHADLPMTSMPLHNRADWTQAIAGDLVMPCGRPVLVVRAGAGDPVARLCDGGLAGHPGSAPGGAGRLAAVETGDTRHRGGDRGGGGHRRCPATPVPRLGLADQARHPGGADRGRGHR
jgi:hypothetical protein